MAEIHPTAVIDPQAKVASDVWIGPFCVVEADAEIASGCRLENRAVVKKGTILGANNVLSEGAVLGGRPQHLAAGEEVGRLHVGDGNQFRENVTVHCGLKPDDVTTLGDGNLLMINAHIGHDCHLHNNIIMANNSMLGGHVTVYDRAYISAAVGVHQFCRVGKMAMVGGQAHVNRDIPPFVTLDGHASEVVGVNQIGLRRNGFSNAEIRQIKEAYRAIYREELTWVEVLAAMQERFSEGPAAEFYQFLKGAKRGIMQERRGSRRATIRIFDGEERKTRMRDVG